MYTGLWACILKTKYMSLDGGQAVVDNKIQDGDDRSQSWPTKLNSNLLFQGLVEHDDATGEPPVTAYTFVDNTVALKQVLFAGPGEVSASHPLNCTLYWEWIPFKSKWADDISRLGQTPGLRPMASRSFLRCFRTCSGLSLFQQLSGSCSSFNALGVSALGGSLVAWMPLAECHINHVCQNVAAWVTGTQCIIPEAA